MTNHPHGIMDAANALTTGPLNALIPDFHFTKPNIEGRASDIVTDLLEANDPQKTTETAELLAAMEVLTKAIRSDPRYTDLLRIELLKNAGVIETPSGTKIETAETAIEYDYSANLEWLYLHTLEKEVAEKRKALEVKLKAIPPGKALVDTETGVTMYGPVKTSKSSYKITLNNRP